MIAVILAAIMAGSTALAQQAVPPPPQPASESQSNATVLKLLRSGVSERAILHVISAGAGSFDTSADALAALKQAGASEAELSAIASQGAAPASAPPAGAQTNSGPSLAETMKYIQDKVNQQGKIEYTVFHRDPATGESSSILYYENPQVIAVDPAGGLSVQIFSGYTGSGYPAENDTETWRLNFKDVGKLEVLSASDSYNRNNTGSENHVSPQYFILDIHLIGGRTVQKHVSQGYRAGWHNYVKSSDSSTGELILLFRDEESADRAAKAFVHAVELCGGGSKPELF
jgi:hypothetical protein